MPRSLYEVLDVARDADVAAIKKAYIKQARDTHPDKCPGDETAHSNCPTDLLFLWYPLSNS